MKHSEVKEIEWKWKTTNFSLIFSFSIQQRIENLSQNFHKTFFTRRLPRVWLSLYFRAFEWNKTHDNSHQSGGGSQWKHYIEAWDDGEWKIRYPPRVVAKSWKKLENPSVFSSSYILHKCESAAFHVLLCDKSVEFLSNIFMASLLG